ncbi:sterol carrier family protein [Rhizohabitans arisaemae]|uniref:sterol carrier family protein n=1 Tax=Rhizohabitans arisaemae TaxID=2720610 RepID=UPI0024B0CB1D|nr:sterol carrier family protein [Rhizohabitans arisaemae]
MPPRRLDAGQVRAALDKQLGTLGRPPYDGPLGGVFGACVAVVAELYRHGGVPERDAARSAVRHLLETLVTAAPGRSVEVRVPPYAAVQCVEGPRHTRGTPPNVVEMDPPTWLALATGTTTWAEAVADGRISASGPRADLSPYLPITTAND